MTLDAIIEKYGMHDLEIGKCKKTENGVTVYAYCHKHNVDGEFMVNYNLKIEGDFRIIELNADDENDIYIDIARIEKLGDGTYEVGGAGDWLHFEVLGDLTVTEISDEEYETVTKGI